jgi:hypothetical protein
VLPGWREHPWLGGGLFSGLLPGKVRACTLMRAASAKADNVGVPTSATEPHNDRSGGQPKGQRETGR